MAKVIHPAVNADKKWLAVIRQANTKDQRPWILMGVTLSRLRCARSAVGEALLGYGISKCAGEGLRYPFVVGPNWSC